MDSAPFPDYVEKFVESVRGFWPASMLNYVTAPMNK
jgi:hypothetical protein